MKHPETKKTSEFPEDLTIKAALKGGLPKVSGVAYTGGKISVGFWSKPVVIALDGLAINGKIPLLNDHYNYTENRLGLVDATIEGNQVLINGEIVSDTEAAREIIAQGKAGADWQLSVGVRAEVVENVLEGQKVVNGIAYDAPFYHIVKSTLREVSVVAVGADAATHASISATAKLKGEDTMKKNEPNPDVTAKAAPAPDVEPVQAPAPIQATAPAADPVKAERQRVADVIAICAGEHADIQAAAISGGWTKEETAVKVLAALREARPAAAPNIIVKTGKAITAKAVEAALCLRAGMKADEIVKDYGEEVIEAAETRREYSITAILGESLRIEGKNIPQGFGNDLIRASFSTVTLPGILSNVANKTLLKAYERQPLVAPRLCSAGDLNDFKVSERFRLTDFGKLQKVGPDGELKSGQVGESRATNQLDTYGEVFTLSRQMIINDDLGAFLSFPQFLGTEAARLIDHLFFTRLLGNPAQDDGQTLFHANHGNLLTGADSALSLESLENASGLFEEQTDAAGEPINVPAKFLLVPTRKRHTAIALAKGDTVIISGGSTKTTRTSLNPLVNDGLEVISSPYLTNANYAGHSAESWYLFSSPDTLPAFEIGYLKGRRTPTIEKGATDFDNLGMSFRVFFDIGIREQDWRGVLKANGQ